MMAISSCCLLAANSHRSDWLYVSSTPQVSRSSLRLLKDAWYRPHFLQTWRCKRDWTDVQSVSYCSSLNAVAMRGSTAGITALVRQMEWNLASVLLPKPQAFSPSDVCRRGTGVGKNLAGNRVKYELRGSLQHLDLGSSHFTISVKYWLSCTCVIRHLVVAVARLEACLRITWFNIFCDNWMRVNHHAGLHFRQSFTSITKVGFLHFHVKRSTTTVQVTAIVIMG